MNPLLLALGQWAVTGLPELIAALNAAAPPTTTAPAPTTPATGWPPALPPETPAAGGSPTATTSGGDPLMRALQVLLGVPEDGYWGPTTRAAVLALKEKLGV